MSNSGALDVNLLQMRRALRLSCLVIIDEIVSVVDTMQIGNDVCSF